MSKSIKQMQAETVEVEHLLGWAGPGVVPNRFPESMMLLVTEVSEAVEAFRNWAYADTTEPPRGADHRYVESGSGFCARCDDMPGEGEHGAPTPSKPEGVGSEFADILIRLLSSCDQYGIDLEAEYERKVAYNRTRSYRHGGKAL